MKGQREVHVRELLLRIQILGTGDYPPTILLGVYVPQIMRDCENPLRIDLLHKLDLLVWSL